MCERSKTKSKYQRPFVYREKIFFIKQDRDTMYSNNFIQKLILFTAILTIFFAALAPQISARAAGSDSAVVAVSALNLRSGPGLDHKIVKVLPLGTRVTLINKNEAGDWTEVRLADDTEGWVFSQHLVVSTVREGKVLVDRLNLRAGPGTSYRIFRTLSSGLELEVTGRSLASDWLVIRLSDGTTGWVFSPFIETSVDISALPVMEAYGGQEGTGKPASPAKSSVLVTIRDNQAIVDISGFPASEEITVSLGLPSKVADLKVVSGKTSSSGSAMLTFKMPATWSDGSSINQSDLRLLVSTDSGSKSMSVSIVYLRW
jgi:uncharacterized protein YraI